MSRLSKQFEILVKTLNKYELYKAGDDVDEDLTALRDVIIEVEKRMCCVKKTAADVYQVISEYTKEVDKGAAFIMPVKDHDVIHTGVTDIEIALDLDDNQPIRDNWHSLFKVKAFKIVSSIHNSVHGKVFDVLRINLDENGYRIGELNVIDPADSTQNLWVNLDLEGECLTEEEKNEELNVQKKDEIEKILISKWANIGMDVPSNFEDIVQFVFEDVCTTADPIEWNDADVVIGFRRWIECL